MRTPVAVTSSAINNCPINFFLGASSYLSSRKPKRRIPAAPRMIPTKGTARRLKPYCSNDAPVVVTPALEVRAAAASRGSVVQSPCTIVNGPNNRSAAAMSGRTNPVMTAKPPASGMGCWCILRLPGSSIKPTRKHHLLHRGKLKRVASNALATATE